MQEVQALDGDSGGDAGFGSPPALASCCACKPGDASSSLGRGDVLFSTGFKPRGRLTPVGRGLGPAAEREKPGSL